MERKIRYHKKKGKIIIDYKKADYNQDEQLHNQLNRVALKKSKSPSKSK